MREITWKLFNDHLESLEFQPGVYFDLSGITPMCT